MCLCVMPINERFGIVGARHKTAKVISHVLNCFDLYNIHGVFKTLFCIRNQKLCGCRKKHANQKVTMWFFPLMLEYTEQSNNTLTILSFERLMCSICGDLRIFRLHDLYKSTKEVVKEKKRREKRSKKNRRQSKRIKSIAIVPWLDIYFRDVTVVEIA